MDSQNGNPAARKDGQYLVIPPSQELPGGKSIESGKPPYFWAKIMPVADKPQKPLSRATLRQPIVMNLFRRPLWHPYVVEECLDILRPRLNHMVEIGELPWAWNLGHGRQRKELRILGHCVVERAMGPIPGIGTTKNLGLPEVVNLILPTTREVFRSVELQRMFHLGPEAMSHLSESGEIKKVPQALSSSGMNASPSFTRRSVVKLLERRRVM